MYPRTSVAALCTHRMICPPHLFVLFKRGHENRTWLSVAHAEPPKRPVPGTVPHAQCTLGVCSPGDREKVAVEG